MKFNGKCAEMEQEGSSKQQVLEYKPAQNYSITEMVELSGVPPTTILNQNWHSFCIAVGDSTHKEKVEKQITEHLDIKTFLWYKHFRDVKSYGLQAEDGCKGDHYHILIKRPFRTKNGREYRASQSYFNQQLQTLCQTYQLPPHSLKQVGNIKSYLKYRSQKPRQLMRWSMDFDSLQAMGYFKLLEWEITSAAYTNKGKEKNHKQKGISNRYDLWQKHHESRR